MVFNIPCWYLYFYVNPIKTEYFLTSNSWILSFTAQVIYKLILFECVYKYKARLQQLQSFVDNKPKKSIIIIGGDVNTSIGTIDNNENQLENDKITGQCDNRYRSDRGERLGNFLGLNKLVATATYFEKKDHNAWSFPEIGDNERQIDRIVIK